MTNELTISNESSSMIPAKLAFEKNVLAVKSENGYLFIAIPNKNDLKLINELSFYTGLNIKPLEFPVELIRSKLKEIYPDFNSGNNGKKEPVSENFISEYSNIEFVNNILDEAIKTGASDIHFEVYEGSFRVRYRLDGHLREILNTSSSKSNGTISRLKILADLDISEKRRPQDGKIRYSYKNKIIDIRVSCLPTTFGEKVVLRILDKSQLTLDLQKLGLNQEQYKIFLKNIHLPYGMILVTGPTGSGKTTTLYAALQEVQSIEKNILTIEDPIEYNLNGINQSHVKPEIGYTFANALRAFLRQDPDIIMVGEIRDKETAEIAIRASLTGHLVFSTLHTNDSLSAVTRLIDMGIEPFLVASSVRLILAQRLVRKLCNCTSPTLKSLQRAGDFEKPSPSERDGRGYGCENCSYSGYKGRTALFEFFEITEDISELISKNSSYKEIKSAAVANGFKTLRESGIEKVKAGITTDEEVLRETTL